VNLALFDFDGTITNRDTMLDFNKFVNGKSNHTRALALTLPSFVLYKLGLLRSDIPKVRYLKSSFKGKTAQELSTSAQAYCKEMSSEIVRPDALRKLKDHLEKGDRVIIVTGGCKVWVEPFAKLWNVELIASEMNFEKGICTGMLTGPNNVAEEKVVRIKSHLGTTQYDSIIAYGDTSNDNAMLAFADQGHYRKFQ
jgi:phosphatidylglycerophosphatase C